MMMGIKSHSSNNTRRISRSLVPAAVLIAAGFFMTPSARSQDLLPGNWTATITFPVTPGSSQTATQTVTFDVSPIAPKSKVGRMTITDNQGNVVAGVWREVGKSISITYEPVCDPTSGSPCGTYLLIGKVKAGAIHATHAVVIWDTKNSQNPALYDTDNGTFSAQAVSQ